jgi:hypothetical protein
MLFVVEVALPVIICAGLPLGALMMVLIAISTAASDSFSQPIHKIKLSKF